MIYGLDCETVLEDATRFCVSRRAVDVELALFCGALNLISIADGGVEVVERKGRR
jgi:hypothetical protein